jgi:hypothetical protein
MGLSSYVSLLHERNFCVTLYDLNLWESVELTGSDRELVLALGAAIGEVPRCPGMIL